MLRRQFESDRALQGNAEDRRTFEAKLLDQGGKVVRMPSDVPDAVLCALQLGQGKRSPLSP